MSPAPASYQPSKETGTSSFVLAALILTLSLGLVWWQFGAQAPRPDAASATKVLDANLATAIRIQPVGSVALREANRVLQTGEAVFQMQCAACHTAGVVGAPKFGVAAEWAPRLGQGLDALVNATLQGKGAMGAQAGGAFSDFEILRAVVYLANAGGGSFTEPAPPAAAQ